MRYTQAPGVHVGYMRQLYTNKYRGTESAVPIPCNPADPHFGPLVFCIVRPLEDQTPTEALAFCVWGICFVLFWGPLGLVAAQCAVCEGAAWVAVCGDCLAVPPARPCARLSVWGCRLALRVVGPAVSAQILGGRAGRSDLRPTPPFQCLFLRRAMKSQKACNGLILN